MAHISHISKSWMLVLACMLNGVYYADYCTLGTMGLAVMHHKTWENLISLVDSYIEQLAQWSCEMRDSII